MKSNRQENELMIPCNCAGNHWLQLSYFVDDENESEWNEFDISFIDYGFTFIERFKKAFRFLFGLEDKIYFSNIMISDEDLVKIKDFINKYLGEIELNKYVKSTKEKYNETMKGVNYALDICRL